MTETKKFKPGKIYKFTGLWNPFKIKPKNIEPWYDFRKWPEFSPLRRPKKCMLYLEQERWYDDGLLAKFLYDGQIVYCRSHNFNKEYFVEVK